ncbi:uncharacterized protein LOC115877032 [Sitophilus oryzae]|uniref:Uncharacterized protein LOC115877032 n=1 Tax=Sitophilus oryzae TaxID=7048 RepID=A0A6J2XCT2_SITOR|nr:uncharacterized protein LOC115877032 [Sitophilus oryzae]
MPANKKTASLKEKNKNRQIEKKKKFQYPKEALKRALFEIQEGNMSVRTASREFRIPKTTLQDHKSGKIPQIQGKTGPPPLLTTEGEEKIANWLVSLAKCGFPLKKTDLLDTVETVLKNTGRENLFKDGRPGQKWYLSFLKRHPVIATREAESINKARAVITEEGIRLWFADLKNYLVKNNCDDILEDPDRILNGDETGFSLCPKTGKVLAPRGWKNVYSVKIGNEKDNITVLLVFTASGKIAPPLVLFPYIRPPKALLASMPPNWILGRSDSGWMRGDNFFDYIANDFNEWVTQMQLKRPILLLIDGHKSHMTMQLSEFCHQNGIILYALPANTTHILQPADVSVFKPLKTEWKKTVREWQNRPENINISVNKINFCRVLQEAIEKANMNQHIINGFKKCGLYPFEPNSVDYTKCVQNFIRQHTSQLKSVQNPQITAYEVLTAKKVVETIREKLTENGINVDFIVETISNLEKDKEQPGDLLVGAVLPMDIFEIDHNPQIILRDYEMQEMEENEIIITEPEEVNEKASNENPYDHYDEEELPSFQISSLPIQEEEINNNEDDTNNECNVLSNIDDSNNANQEDIIPENVSEATPPEYQIKDTDPIANNKTESNSESDKLENANKEAEPESQRNKIDSDQTEFDVEPDKLDFNNRKEESEQEIKTNLKSSTLNNECKIKEILSNTEELEQNEREVEDRSVKTNCDNKSDTQEINVPEKNSSEVSGNTEKKQAIRYVTYH